MRNSCFLHHQEHGYFLPIFTSTLAYDVREVCTWMYIWKQSARASVGVSVNTTAVDVCLFGGYYLQQLGFQFRLKGKNAVHCKAVRSGRAWCSVGRWAGERKLISIKFNSAFDVEKWITRGISRDKVQEKLS